MNPVPVTYLFDFEHCSDRMRPYIMAEFAANHVKHLVLNDMLIRDVMKSLRFGDQLKKEIDGAGLTFVDSHAPFGSFEDLNVPDPARRPAMLERLKLALRIAADFGVDSMTVHTGNTPQEWGNYTPEQFHEALIASLDALLPLAAELNVTIAIENIWFVTNTPEKLLNVIERFRSPHLGICYDAGHANLMKCDRKFEQCAAVDAWSAFGAPRWDDRILEKLHPFITTCHIHDNHGQYDNHLIPGKGTIDWPHVSGLLKTAPRLKCIQCETIPVVTGSSIAEICRAMQKLFS